MTAGFDAFDHPLRESNLWLKLLMEKLLGSDRHVAYAALRAALDVENIVRSVFEVVWEKVDPGGVAKLIELFPVEVRGLWQQPAQPA